MGELEQKSWRAAEQCAWTLLGSVGMSSASGERANHSVSPEDALVVASIASATDGRLRDEARDWFVAFDDLVSRPALKHRVVRLSGRARDQWSEFASPLQGHVRGTIPGVDARTGANFERSGKTRRSIGPDVAHGLLRFRAAFGTQARADVLFLLATTPDNVRGSTADALARSAGYGKSGVREALDRLTEAGLTRRTRIGNADWFALSVPEYLATLMGNVATPPIDSQCVAPVFSTIIEASRLLDAEDDPTVFVPARAMFEPVDRELGDLRAQLPQPTHDFERGRAELVEMIERLADRMSDPSRSMWPW